MSIYVGKRAQIQNQKLRNLLRSKCMHDGQFSGPLRQQVVSEPRRITQSGPFDSFCVRPSLKPHLEEVLIAAHRIKGVSTVTTVPHHQATMNTEIDALISKINELIVELIDIV
jgi:hypothetical protein